MHLRANFLFIFLKKQNTEFSKLDGMECQDGVHNCHEQATCNETEGSYSCTCKTGWTGDGFDCQGSQIIFEQRNLPSPDFHSPHYEY